MLRISRVLQSIQQGRRFFSSALSLLNNSNFNASQPIKILVGTQTGTAMGFAQNLIESFMQKEDSMQKDPSSKTAIEVIDLEEYDPSQFHSQDKQVIMIMACYGAGEPTDNAKRFYSSVMTGLKSAKDLRYAIFGLGSSKTHPHNYNIVAKSIDGKLQQLGANRIFPVGFGDDSGCIEVDFHQWQEKLLDHILDPNTSSTTMTSATTITTTTTTEEENKKSDKTAKTETAPSCPAEPAFSLSFIRPDPKEKDNKSDDTSSIKAILKQSGFYKSNTLCFPVLSNTALNPNYCDSMLEMHLGEPKAFNSNETMPPFSYETGDHIGIYATNHPNVVERLAKRCNYPLDNQVVFNQGQGQGPVSRKAPLPSGLTVKEALSHCLEIQTIPRPLGVNTLATHAKNPKEKEKLESISKNPDLYKDYIWRGNRHLVDLLEEFPSIELPFASLLQILQPLQPRYYSISSSSISHPNQVHVTYRWVHYRNPYWTEERQGVCTTYLKNLILNQDTKVCGFIRKSTFRQPADPMVPMVMIAGGSGIAPLKAFLAERLHLIKTTGKKYGTGILLFGVRSPEDLVFSELIESCLKVGALTSAHVSYSSPSNDGSYTPKFVSQDIELETEKIWKAISEGGNVYLCGGASAFASTCGKALRQIFRTKGRLDAQGAEDYLLSLIRQNRYMEDLSD